MKSKFFCIIAWLMAAFLSLTALNGCGARPQEAKEADETRKQALENYRNNTNKVHEAEQQAYREASLKMVEKLFDMDMAQLATYTDKDGKVEASKALALLTKANQHREAGRAAVEDEIRKMKETVAEADREFLVANKLDELLGKFYDSGISPADAQPFVNQILDIVRNKK